MPENDVCSFIGGLQKKWKGQKGKRLGVSRHYMEFLQQGSSVIDRYPDLYSIDYEVWSGGYDTGMENWRKMADNSLKERFTYKDFMSALKRRGGGRLGLPKMPALTARDVYGVQIHPDKFSGYLTSKLFGRSKGEAASKSAVLAEEVFRHITKAPTTCLDL